MSPDRPPNSNSPLNVRQGGVHDELIEYQHELSQADDDERQIWMVGADYRVGIGGGPGGRLDDHEWLP